MSAAQSVLSSIQHYQKSIQKSHGNSARVRISFSCIIVNWIHAVSFSNERLPRFVGKNHGLASRTAVTSAVYFTEKLTVSIAIIIVYHLQYFDSTSVIERSAILNVGSRFVESSAFMENGAVRLCLCIKQELNLLLFLCTYDSCIATALFTVIPWWNNFLSFLSFLTCVIKIKF